MAANYIGSRVGSGHLKERVGLHRRTGWGFGGQPSTKESEARGDGLVYSPYFSEVSHTECNRPFGKVVKETLEKASEKDSVPAQVKFGEETFGVDAALVELDSNAGNKNTIKDL